MEIQFAAFTRRGAKSLLSKINFFPFLPTAILPPCQEKVNSKHHFFCLVNIYPQIPLSIAPVPPLPNPTPFLSTDCTQPNGPGLLYHPIANFSKKIGAGAEGGLVLNKFTKK